MFLFAARPPMAKLLTDSQVTQLFDRWLELTPTDFAIVVYLFRTAAESPGGVVAHFHRN